MKNTLCTLILSSVAFVSSVNAEPIMVHDYPEAKNLFYTETKVDHSLPNGGQRGHDIAVRTGNGSHGDSSNLNWLSYDGNHNLDWFKHTFDWSITRDGTDTTYSFGGTTVQTQSLEGDWDALGIYFNTSGWSGYFFDNAYINMTLDTWNETALIDPISYKSKLGKTKFMEFTDSDEQWIESVSGTATFHWNVKDYYSYYHWKEKSPNGRLAMYFKGYDYLGADYTSPGNDADIPIDETGNIIENPTNVGAPMLASAGLLMLGASWVRRRKSLMQM